MKKQKLIGCICTLLLLGATNLLAQQNTVASGGDASGSGGSLSYSIGQIDYVQATGSGGTVNQGVQQPFEIFVLGVNTFPNIHLTASVYPNPTVSSVTLKITKLATETLSFRLYDLSGRLVLENSIVTEETNISMEGLSSTIYVLNVFDRNSLLKTFKIIKK